MTLINNIAHLKTKAFSNTKRVVLRLVVILFITTLSLTAKGQFALQVNDKDAQPVVDARVLVIPIEEANPYAKAKAYYTNLKGRVNSAIGGVCLVKVSGQGFTETNDTIKLVAGKLYTIGLKELVHTTTSSVVTGQYSQTSVDKSVSKIRVIDAKRIEAQGAVTLRDVLTNELNVRISQDNILGSGLSLQGISGQNIKILIDGVPMIGRLDGNIDISQINMNNVERIEIIEGPMSVMYGTDALGGVINIITKKASKYSVEGNVNSYYESVGNYNIDGRVAFKTPKKTTVQISGGRNFFDGFGESGLRGRVQQWKPKEQYFADATVGFNINKSQHRLQSIFFDELLLNKGEPVIRPYSVYAFDNYFYTRRISNSLFSDFNLSNGAKLNIINSYSWFRRYNIQQRKELVTLEQNQTQNPTDHDTSIFDLIMSRGTYTQTVNKKFSYQLGYDINIETGTGGRIENNRQQVGDYAAYATLEYRPALRWVFRPGLRASHNTRFGSPLAPSFNAKYTVSNKLNIRASYARGFRAPSIKELNLFFVDINHNIQPNPNLNAEISDNVNFSAVYSNRLGKGVTLKVEPSVFYNDIRNMISLALVDATTQLYNYVNIGQFNNVGGNFAVSLNTNRIALQLGTSLTAFKNTINAADLPNYNTTQEYRANISYTVPITDTKLNVFYKYNGAVPGFAIGANNEVEATYIQAYSMADVSISQSFLNNRVTVIAGARNLLNVGNINFNVPSGVAHSGNGNTMAIGMGRTFFTSIKIHLFNLNK